MNQTEAEIRARFSRFLSNFSHIETLVLDGSFESKTFDTVARTLENVRVNRLEVIALTGSLKMYVKCQQYHTSSAFSYYN